MMSAHVNISQSPELRSKRLKYFVRVQTINDEAAGIRSFELVTPNGDQLPSFTAGAHIDVHLGDDIVRQYSLCSSPSEREKFRIAVLLEVSGRGGSFAMHKIKEGDLLEISGPRNHFALAGPETSLHLMVAGGIGVTPMMSMIPELEAKGANYVLHYCTRRPENTAFLNDLTSRVESNAVHIHHDHGDPSRGLDIKALVSNYVPGMHIYFCGPPGFMATIKEHLGAWPPHAVHFEHFSAPEADADRENHPFKIVLRKTGEALEVSATESIVDVLRARGYSVETDCREGFCGTCITRYLSGTPEHRDCVLSVSERQKYLMICCARAESPSLTLDL
jgi:ferredoxin-NADP reductase